MGVIAAGVFKFYFPFPRLFSCNRCRKRKETSES